MSETHERRAKSLQRLGLQAVEWSGRAMQGRRWRCEEWCRRQMKYPWGSMTATAMEEGGRYAGCDGARLRGGERSCEKANDSSRSPESARSERMCVYNAPR